MKVILQRVSEASVTVNNSIVGQINRGILILVGISPDDSEDDILWLTRKISQLRIFNDSDKKMNLSIQDVKGQYLVISQFTLHASTKKGNRPSYINAAKPETAIPLYESFLKNLQINSIHPVEKGIFGADMKVQLVNDGPVTIIIDTKNKI